MIKKRFNNYNQQCNNQPNRRFAMVHLLVHHSVEDYNKWKPVFDEHESARAKAGSKGAQVFRMFS